jgi:alkylated DNA repair dioxygenase AlkB
VTPAIPGLRYFPDYLDTDQHDCLLAAATAHGWRYAGSRRARVYGYSYSPAKGGVYRVDDLPEWAVEIAQRLCREALMPCVADQMIANEYAPGTGIRPHVDAPLFDNTIVSLSLGSHCVMQFTENSSGRVEELFVEPRSALVFSGEVRHKWKHGIPARSQDVWMDQVLTRRTRVSLTFRKMLSTSATAAK